MEKSSEGSKLKLLTAKELIAQTNLHNEIDPSYLVRGLKAKYPQNTADERQIIANYLGDLRKVLSMERVALKHDRSVAKIEDGKIKMVKRQGKWEAFESSGMYFEPHEALFLMEINRLEVYLGKVIVSLERAYHMFLKHEDSLDNSNDNDKLTKNEYIVYSHFMRFGCNLRRFKNENVSKTSPDRQMESGDSEDDGIKPYVWSYLQELLGNRKAANSSTNLDPNRYNCVKNSMDRIIGDFRNVDSTAANDCVDDGTSDKVLLPSKRKQNVGCDSDEPVSKSSKLCHKINSDDQYLGSGSTNDFMIDSAFHRFKSIFNKIDIIELKTMNFHGKQHNSNKERFSFDLWTSLDYRTSQYRGPNFRLIVKHSSKSLPRNDDIFQLYQSLLHKSAIIVVCINEEMSFQAYVYRFTT